MNTAARLVLLFIFSLISTASAQVPVTPGRALGPLERKNMIPPVGVQRPPPPPAQPPPPVQRPVIYYQPPVVPQKTNEPPAKISKKIAISKIEVAPGKEEGLTATLYVTNLTDEALAPFAEFTLLSTNKTDVGVEFGRIRNLGPKEVGKMEVNTTKTGAANFKLVKISSKLGED